MYINNFKKIALSVVASSLLVGCGSSSSGGSSSDKQDTQTVSMQGVAIDGYVSGSTVILKNSSGEELSRTTTDSSGDWNFSDVVIPDGSIVEVSGGMDVSTGEDFEGVLKAPAETDGSEVVTTPLTTLVTALVQSGKSIADAKSTVSIQLGITLETLDLDPIETLKNGTDTQKADAAKAIKKALVIQKTAETLAKSVGGSDSAFAAVMNAVASKLEEGTTFDTVMSNTDSIVSEVVKDEEIAKDENAQAKLEAVASSALSIVTMIEAMDVSDLTVSGADVAAVLENKSKAMEVITSEIEEKAESISNATNTSSITSAKENLTKTSNALIAMGGIDGIQKTIAKSTETIDASSFADSYLTDDIITSNAETYSKLKDAGFTDTSDILGVSTDIATNEDDNQSIEDIIKGYVDTNDNVTIDDDSLKDAIDSVEDSKDKNENQADDVIDDNTGAETISQKVEILLSPSKTATVSDAKTLFKELRDTTEIFVNLDDSNINTIIGSQEQDIDAQIVPEIENFEEKLRASSTALEDSVTEFTESLENFENTFDLIESRFDFIDSYDMKSNWTGTSNDTNDTITHKYVDNNDGTITRTITINNETLIVTHSEDEEEINFVSSSGSITLNDDEKYTLTVTSVSFVENSFTFTGSGTIYGDNNANMSANTLSVTFNTDDTLKNTAHFVNNLEVNFEGTINTDERKLEGKLVLSESDSTKNQLIGTYTGLSNEPTFTGTLSSNIKIDDVKTIIDDEEQTIETWTNNSLIMATPTNGTKSFVVKTTKLSSSLFNDSATGTSSEKTEYTLLTQNGDTINCTVTTDTTNSDESYTTINTNTCTDAVIEVFNDYDKIITATVDGVELIIDSSSMQKNWTSESTYISSPMIDFINDDRGVTSFSDTTEKLQLDSKDVNITNIIQRDPSSIEEFAGDMSFEGEFTYSDVVIKGNIGIRKIGASTGQTVYAKDIEITDGKHIFSSDELKVTFIDDASVENASDYYGYSIFENYQYGFNYYNPEEDSFEFTTMSIKNLKISALGTDGQALTITANLEMNAIANNESVLFDGLYTYGTTKYEGNIDITGNETTKDIKISGTAEIEGETAFGVTVNANETNDMTNGYVMLTKGSDYEVGIKMTENVDSNIIYERTFMLADTNGVLSTYTDYSDTKKDITSIVFKDKDGKELATYGENENGNNWEIKYSDNSAETLF